MAGGESPGIFQRVVGLEKERSEVGIWYKIEHQKIDQNKAMESFNWKDKELVLETGGVGKGGIAQKKCVFVFQSVSILPWSLCAYS